MAAQHELQGHAGEHHGAAAAGQAIEAVGEVGGVAFRHEHEQAQGPDQQTQGEQPAEGQRDRGRIASPHPAPQAGPEQEQQGSARLQQQFPPGAQAGVGSLRQAAPVVDRADRQEGQRDSRHRQQAGITRTGEPSHQHSHRHHQQATHRGRTRLALVALGAFRADHLAQLEGPQAWYPPTGHPRTHQGGHHQGDGEAGVGH